MENTSNQFQLLMGDEGGKAYMDGVMKLAENSAIDQKHRKLAYISVLSAIRLKGGMNFHVKNVKNLGATWEEVKSAVLVGLPAVGLCVTEALGIAYESYHEHDHSGE